MLITYMKFIYYIEMENSMLV